MLSLDDAFRPAPGAVSRKSEDELVVVLPEKGKFLVLNDTGAYIWQLSDGSRTLRDIAAAMAENWEIEQARADADVLHLAGQLIERGALVGLEAS